MLNAGPLHKWAQGNFALITYSFFTFYMTMFCAMLLTGQPAFMMAPKGTRQVIFILSLVQVIIFNAQALGYVVKYFKGVQMTESFATIVGWYMLMEQVGAFVPSFFIFLFDGIAFSPYALFNKDYGKWNEVDDLPGFDDFMDNYAPQQTVDA